MSFHVKGIVIGHVISDKKIEANKAKVNLISSLLPPSTVKEIRSFLGHVWFYHRFIKDFNKISKPLCNLLAKDVAFVFDNECLKAFEQLKAMLTSISFNHRIGKRPLRSCAMHLTMQLEQF